MKMKSSTSRKSITICVFVLVACFSMCQFVGSECSRNIVIFNFGDSNSDTGGYAAAHGTTSVFPYGRTFFHRPSDRFCDGRLIIDFLCENLNISYLTPYLQSVRPNFKNGANFAIAGTSTLPKDVLFSLSTQVRQFIRFVQLQSTGLKELVEKEDLKKALYMIDIGQNDLDGAFTYFSQASQVIEIIHFFISEIQDAIMGIYKQGGRNFWIHNTGPLGCLPEKIAIRNASNLKEVDDYDCVKSMNEAAQAFNNQLCHLCEQLRLQMKDTTIVYVDMYAIKYDLIANSSAYGIQNPLKMCCGYCRSPCNYNSNITNCQNGCTLCEYGSAYVRWDGIHYTEFANSIVASKILSSNYSTPPLPLHHFCTLGRSYSQIKEYVSEHSSKKSTSRVTTSLEF